MLELEVSRAGWDQAPSTATKIQVWEVILYENLGTSPVKQQLPLVSMRAEARDSLDQAVLQYLSVFMGQVRVSPQHPSKNHNGCKLDHIGL